MLVNRDRFLLLAAALAACHKPTADHEGERPPAQEAAVIPAAAPPHPSASTASPRTTDSASRAADATTFDASEACARLIAKNREILSHPARDCAAEGMPEDRKAMNFKSVRDRLMAIGRDGLFTLCHPGHGTWMVSVLKAGFSEPAGEGGPWCAAAASYELIYVSPDGERTTSKPRRWDEGDGAHSSNFAAQFDVDGDGRDELVLDDVYLESGSPPLYSVEVLRAKDSVISDYPVGFHIDQTTDADGDGRPDFVTNSYFSVPGRCAYSFGYAADILGVPLLVHSLPGGNFSMSDEVARRWAKRECPAAPTAPQSAADASCARLWGHSADDIARNMPDASEVCELPDDVRAFVRRTPPFKSLDLAPAPPLPGAKWKRQNGQYSEKGRW
jgi:hypothetical protein